MPDKPISEEFGKPMSEGTKTSDEIFDARYGRYKESWGPSGVKDAPVKNSPTPIAWK
jgi:hypothetical protein